MKRTIITIMALTITAMAYNPYNAVSQERDRYVETVREG